MADKLEKQLENSQEDKRDFIFLLVTDMNLPDKIKDKEMYMDMKMGKDEIVVTSEKMQYLYGKWLARRRKFALKRKKNKRKKTGAEEEDMEYDLQHKRARQ